MLYRLLCLRHVDAAKFLGLTTPIRAFEARAVVYLLKPVDESRFMATIEHVREVAQ